MQPAGGQGGVKRLWRNRNVEVHIWTINEPEDMQRFIDKGLDGIMTDRTDTLLEILGR